MTVVELLNELTAAGCQPTVSGSRLVVAGRVPDHLRGPLLVAHTGIRAALGNQQWIGGDGEGTQVTLSPAELVPTWATTLAVAADRGARDRIPPAAKTVWPELFDDPPPAGSDPRIRVRITCISRSDRDDSGGVGPGLGSRNAG